MTLPLYETNVADEDAYKKALPDVLKCIKEAGGVILSAATKRSWFMAAGPEVGNRYVIVRGENEATYDRY